MAIATLVVSVIVALVATDLPAIIADGGKRVVCTVFQQEDCDPVTASGDAGQPSNQYQPPGYQPPGYRPPGYQAPGYEAPGAPGQTNDEEDDGGRECKGNWFARNVVCQTANANDWVNKHLEGSNAWMSDFNDGLLLGFWDAGVGLVQAVGFVGCLAHICSHAGFRANWSGLNQLVFHPTEAFPAIWEDMTKYCRDLGNGEETGRCGGNIIGSIIGAKGLNKLKTLRALEKLDTRFGGVVGKLDELGFKPKQIERMLDNVTRHGEDLTQHIDNLARNVEAGRVPRNSARDALRQLNDAISTGKLNQDSYRQLLSRIGSGEIGNFEGAYAEIQVVRHITGNVDLAPGTRVFTHAKMERLVDLGDGRHIDIDPVPQADLLYRTADDIVHLDEVKATPQALANKLRHAPQQLANMRAWYNANRGARKIELRVLTDRGFTALFGGRGRDYMQRIFDAEIPLEIGKHSFTPERLRAFHTAIERMLERWHAVHGFNRDGDFYRQEVLENIDNALEYVKH